MPSYWRLKLVKPRTQRRRVISNLERVRAQLRAELPSKKAEDTVILGTWNLRNFDDNRFGDGPRLDESLWYIAEIVSAFDILAIQEVCDDLGPLEAVMSRLDPVYDYIITDVTEGPGGNRERLGFIYNRDKVKFLGVAGEIVLPYSSLISDVTKQRQFARTPFSCLFQSGWFKFMFSTVHIYFGKDSANSPEYARRVEEIRSVSKFLAKRADKDRYCHIMVGDFNIEDFDGATFDALQEHGFEVFKNKRGSNSDLTRFYDQISFKARDQQMQLAPPEPGREVSHGVFHLFDSLFRGRDWKDYESVMKATLKKKIDAGKKSLAKAKAKKAAATTQAKKDKAQKSIDKVTKSIAKLTKTRNTDAGLKAFFKSWRTYQLSDHMPLWVELQIDFSKAYLERIK
jgi:exonuclease III